MGEARQHLHHLYLVATHLIFPHGIGLAVLIEALAAQLDESVTTHHDEFLVLGVMPVLTLGDARLGDVDRHLPAVGGADNLGETAPLVDIHP